MLDTLGDVSDRLRFMVVLFNETVCFKCRVSLALILKLLICSLGSLLDGSMRIFGKLSVFVDTFSCLTGVAAGVAVVDESVTCAVIPASTREVSSWTNFGVGIEFVGNLLLVITATGEKSGKLLNAIILQGGKAVGKDIILSVTFSFSLFLLFTGLN